MKTIGIITNEDLGLSQKEMNKPKTRISARGIVLREDGKIAVFYKSKKREYKLPGGGIENNESIRDCFIREVLEETGCSVNIIRKLGMIEENRENDNFKQISHVFEAKVINKQKKTNLTKKEKDEGGKVLWMYPEKALILINKSINKVKASKYENLYHSRFIILRDKKILEYYLNSLNNDTKWNGLYNKYIDEDYKNWQDYFKIKMSLKKKFIDLVIKYSNNKPVLECGCGTGKTAVYLTTLNIKSYAMDKEKDMVERTKRLSEEVNPKNIVKAFLGDIKSIPYEDKYFSVTHSSGVMEHYSDNDIINLINEQLRVSDYCIFSVPSSYFEKKMLGNERFLSKKEWRNIITKSNGRIIKETGYHYKTFGKRILDILKKPKKVFKPIALYVFVLKEK